MSAHNGEALDEIVRVDAMGQRDIKDSSKVRMPTTGFTAINNELSSFQPRFVPLSHRKRGIDLDQIYELPDDLDSLEPESEEADTGHRFVRKRKDHGSSSPIAKRLAGAWDNQPELDTHKRDVESNAVTTGQSSVSKYVALSTRNHTPLSYQQLPTSGQTKLFSNVPILKATIEGSGADFKGCSSLTTPSLHRGVITTEDMLKSCPDKVSKITLAKLASFWYQEASSIPIKAEMWPRKTVNEQTRNQSLQPPKLEQSCVSQLESEAEFNHELRIANTVQLALQNADEQDDFAPSGEVCCHSIDNGSDDDFNDNLDEGDLLILMSEVEAHLPSSDIPRPSSAACILRWSPSSSHILPVSGQGDGKAADGELPDRSIVDDGSDEIIGLVDNERDLCFDQDEEMLDLSPFPGEVTETFHPPSSACPRADSSEGELYDSSLQYSEPNSLLTAARAHASSTGISTDLSSGLHIMKGTSPISDFDPGPLDDQDEINWGFIDSIPRQAQQHVLSAGIVVNQCQYSIQRLTGAAYEMPPSFQGPEPTGRKTPVSQVQSPVGNTEKYQPLTPFGRPNFPARIRDRSPILGLTSNVLLRTCFRIGEAFFAGGQCDSTKQDAVIELYARVTFSSREEGTVKQHFQFRDLYYDRPPYLNGILENYKSRDLINGESKVFIGESGKEKMVRCLGRLKRDMKKKDWKMLIDNVRETDWEEIRHTKRVLTEGWVKEEKIKKTV